MKKIYSILAVLFVTASVLGQAPQSMSYQAVIRSSNNTLVVSTPVGLQISVLQGGNNGTPVYVETQTATTNTNGLVSIAIGTGTTVTGSFAGINWEAGPYFIKTEIDPTGGTNYSITSTEQTTSVPYVLYGTNGVQPGTAAGQMEYWNGSTWLKIEPVVNTNAKLLLINGVPAWVAVPDAPTIGTVTVGVGQATINYTEPANNGGDTITSYTATSSPGGITVTVYQAGSGAITLTGLNTLTSYTFTVTAANAAGTSMASAPSNSVTPRTIPGAPTIGTATAGNGQATITYTAPAGNGGAAINSYTATSSPGGFTGTLSQAGSGSIIVAGLTNGIEYTFTVTATNVAGTSLPTAPSNSITPSTIPDAPTIGTATAGAGQASIAFTAPDNNGGGAITSYTATSTPGGFTGTLYQAGSGTITVTGLTNGAFYTFTVTAINAAGTSAASAPSNSVRPRTIPGAPTIGIATAGGGQATITYTAPASIGGAVITSYTATSSPGGFTGTLYQSFSGTITVTGLTAGTAYTFTVTATNAAGTSAASAPSNAVTPYTIPNSPTIGTATAGAGLATVTYTAPVSNGGANITSYRATSSPGGLTGSVSQAGSGTITVTGLTAGTAYTFTVTATNAAGTSLASAASTAVTPYTIPGAPIIGTATAGAGQATVTYTAPANNGGAVISSYTATSSPAGFTGTVSQAGSGTITLTAISNFTASTAYTFTVKATNVAGSSIASAPSNSVLPSGIVSGAPTIGTATAGSGQATIAYTAPASNGGFAITGYTATSSPGGFTGTLSQAGSGTITVTGLTNGTAYTFSVKATNAAGTSLASAVSNSVTPLESVTIGTQVWTNKNLDVTTYSDGTVIPQVTDPTAWAALTTGAWCYYNNTTANGTTYGKLYNFYAYAGVYDAASGTNAALRKKLAPTGWHLATRANWSALYTDLGGDGGLVGGKMKSTGISLWTTPNTSATNSSGFTGLPGGRRNTSGSFHAINLWGEWWGPDNIDNTSIFLEYYDQVEILKYDSANLSPTNSLGYKAGVSVRLVRD